MEPGNYPPPQLPPAGWYADPSGESSLRYWDGRQWTPAADAMPAALREHQCRLVVDRELSEAVGMLRLWRLIAASVRGGGEDRDRIIDEMEGCAACLRIMLSIFAVSSASVLVAESKHDEAAAIAAAEATIGELVKAARQLL
jgi:hypothetical protein